MAERGFALFDSPIGRCGIVWGKPGLAGLQLPESNDAATRKKLLSRFSDIAEAAPPAAVARDVRRIVALLEGDASDLSPIVLDMDGVPPFHRRVYDAARCIPPGETASYGEVAHRLGAPGSARAVGQALGRNPFAIIVPCHRVLAANGKVGGFSANGGITTKIRLLSMESAALKKGTQLFEGDGAFAFDPNEAVRVLRGVDARMAALIDTVGPFAMRLKRTTSIFHALAEAVVYQQLNGRAAATIFARVSALFPGGHEELTPAHVLKASEAKLRGAGLSRNKFLSLRDLAEKAKAREIPTLSEVHAMDDETIIERLTAVRGIGRWTVEMLLMFRLGRPDILPVDDYGVRKGYSVAYGKRAMPTPRVLAKFGERYAPFRSVASWYLWRAADPPKK
jgi:methylated-DNA-[protein]-cysteine S-methyltransferase